MAGVTGSQRVPFIILRIMRRPILVLVLVYAISMLGWTLIPGRVGDEEAAPLGLFHAFYFLAYTATTTGFGELPHPFSEAQRMWATVSLYAGVVAWLYAIGALIRLIGNPHLQQAVAERRFSRAVSRLPGPFVVMCGFGNTGSLLARGLSDSGIDTVILDRDPDRVHAVFLRDYRVSTPTLCADARIPERLIDAGLTRPNCRAVLALTSNDDVNVKVAVTARLLNPATCVIVHAQHDTHEETLAALGPQVRIVDPFQTYARYLSATIHNPLVHMLDEWLVGAPHANLAMYPEIPRGRWILCGYGRMGRHVRDALKGLKIPTIVIDPEIDPEDARAPDLIRGRATQSNLQRAGVATAAGIVAGTDSDTENLSIVINARALNPSIFVIVRQNLYRNQVLFNAAEADLIMQPNLVTARRILFILIAPLLRDFFEQIRANVLRPDDTFLIDVVARLRERVGDARPRLWTITIDERTASALAKLLHGGIRVRLGDLLRDPARREEPLPVVPLVVRSRVRGSTDVMPADDTTVAAEDEILFCGSDRGWRLLDAALNNPYTLDYLLTGIDRPRSWLLARWSPSQAAGRQSAA